MRIIVWMIAGLGLFLGLDHAIFSATLYGPWADPFSTAGRIVSELDSVRHMQLTKNAILVLGDSRVAEGFSVALADDVAAQTGAPARFGKLAVPGTTPRVWYYLLRATGLRRDHANIVAVMLNSYHDDDRENLADRAYDIAFLHPLLGPLDIFDFPASFESRTTQEAAAQAVLLKGYAYNTDLHDFLSAPYTRIVTAEGWHAHGADWLRTSSGTPTSLAGLALDPGSGKITVPPHTDPAQAEKLQLYADFMRRFHGRPPDNQPSHDYRALWLPRIAALCASAHARLFVFRIPRGPLHDLVGDDDVPSGVVAQMASAGQISLLPAKLFDHLERPEYFADELHLNAAGRKIFSRELAAALLDHLATGS